MREGKGGGRQRDANPAPDCVSLCKTTRESETLVHRQETGTVI